MTDNRHPAHMLAERDATIARLIAENEQLRADAVAFPNERLMLRQMLADTQDMLDVERARVQAVRDLAKRWLKASNAPDEGASVRAIANHILAAIGDGDDRG